MNRAGGEGKTCANPPRPIPPGIYGTGRVRTSANGKVYGYVYYMQLVDLKSIAGLK